MFGKKKESVAELPVERVRAMMRSGMSEKDIVRQLKAEGHSFGEIEKALMSAVKEGASPLPPGGELGMPPGPAEMPDTMPRQMRQMRQMEAPPVPAPMPMQPYASQPSYPTYMSDEEIQPEVIMEELIESVAEEKFSNFSNEIKGLKSEVDTLRSQILDIRHVAEAKPAPEIPHDLVERLDNFETRLGGLEKAFKQLLPALSENLEVLSKLITERKRAQMPQQQRPLMQQRPTQMQPQQQRPQQAAKPQQKSPGYSF